MGPSPTPHSPAGSRWLRHFSKLLVCATVFLIFLGGQVKSHDAGLAVPDWPTTYGVNMFLYHWSNWVGGIFHEHVHRLVASSVGLMCIVLCAWLYARESRPWVRTLGVVALVLVILQGLLGGLTVMLQLPAAVSTSHAVLAQSFLMLTVFVAYSLSIERSDRPRATVSPAWKLAGGLTLLIYVQLILGALMRHTESGLAIPDFPTMGGRYLPLFDSGMLAWINDWRFDKGYVNGQLLEPVTIGQVLIHFSHRVGAGLIAAWAVFVTWRVFRDTGNRPEVRRAVCLLDGLIVLQAGLGIFTVWMAKYPLVTSIHVATGAAVLGCSTLLLLRACPAELTVRAASASVSAGSATEPSFDPIST